MSNQIPSERRPVYVIAGHPKHGVTFPVERLTDPKDKVPKGFFGISATEYKKLTGRNALDDYHRELNA
jgi:hypothetical protein